MRISRKRVSVALLVGAVGVMGLMVMAQMASATHPRPKGATPLRVSIVPAFKQCTAPNRTHGAPLAFPSCNPPVQTSNFLTVGSPDANGAPANSVGFDPAATCRPASGPPRTRRPDQLERSPTSAAGPRRAASVCNSANAG